MNISTGILDNMDIYRMKSNIVMGQAVIEGAVDAVFGTKFVKQDEEGTEEVGNLGTMIPNLIGYLLNKRKLKKNSTW